MRAQQRTRRPTRGPTPGQPTSARGDDVPKFLTHEHQETAGKHPTRTHAWENTSRADNSIPTPEQCPPARCEAPDVHGRDVDAPREHEVKVKWMAP